VTAAGRQVVALLLDVISGGWWTVLPEKDARIIDRGIARFLAEIEEPCCPRCGNSELYGSGPYCKRHYQQVWRKKSKKSGDMT